MAAFCSPDFSGGLFVSLACLSHQSAVDFRSDPVLYEACKEDSESLCQGVDNGGGRVQACLVRREDVRVCGYRVGAMHTHLTRLDFIQAPGLDAP